MGGQAVMKLRNADGTWRAQVVVRDGAEVIRVSHYGFWHADVRTPAELDKIVPLATLTEESK